MASLADRVFDNGLTVLDTEANALHLCSTEPTTYTEATSTYTIGNETTISVGAPADRGGGGREVTLAAISAGTVTATGTANYWALVDTSNSRLLAVGLISPAIPVTSGNTFQTSAVTIGLTDPS